MPFLTAESRVEVGSPFVGGRADRLVQDLVRQSRSFVNGLFDHDCVTLNGKMEPDAGRRLEIGDLVAVRYEADRRYTPKPRPKEAFSFQVEFEDEYLIVVHKPPEMLTVPSPQREKHTLVDRVSAYLKHYNSKQRAHVVQRLDRGVSGVLVFAKTKEIGELLQDQFSMQKPERKYVALVTGKVFPPAGEFKGFLATGKTLTRFSTDDPDSGEYAETHYRTVQAFRDATMVEVELVTGRRNQIRVHFAEAGHPILGDERYEREHGRHPGWPHKRLALHAKTLGFQHPVTRQQMRFDSPLPPEFTQFVSKAPRAPKPTTQHPAMKHPAMSHPAMQSSTDERALKREHSEQAKPVTTKKKSSQPQSASKLNVPNFNKPNPDRAKQDRLKQDSPAKKSGPTTASSKKSVPSKPQSPVKKKRPR